MWLDSDIPLQYLVTGLGIDLEAMRKVEEVKKEEGILMSVTC